MKSRLFYTAIILTFLWTIPSKAQTKQVQSETIKIAALLNDTSNPYWQTLKEGITETAEKENTDVEIFELDKATNAEGQLNQCQIALLKKPDAILFAAVNQSNLAPCLNKATQQGILLVDLDGNITQEQAKSQNLDISFSVASNNYELGEKAAQYILEKLNGGEVLIIEGLTGSEPSRLRVEGFKNTAKPNLKIIASLPADWDRAKAADIVDQILLAHPNLKAIFAANDTMALGAMENLRAKGRSDIIVVGVDGVKDAITAIQDGKLNATIAQLPYLMGKLAIEKTIKQLSQKETFDFRQIVPVLTIDKNTIEQNQNELLQYVR